MCIQCTVVGDYSHLESERVGDSRFIFNTAHRRENLGEQMHNMFRAIRRVLDEHPDVKAIYPIHMNPVVRKAAETGKKRAEFEQVMDVYVDTEWKRIKMETVGKGKKGSKSYSAWQKQWEKYEKKYREHMGKRERVK